MVFIFYPRNPYLQNRRTKLLFVLIVVLAVFGWRGTIADFYVRHFTGDHSMAVSGQGPSGDIVPGNWLHGFRLMLRQTFRGADPPATVEADVHSGGKKSAGQRLQCDQAVAHKKLAMSALAEDRVEEYQTEMALSNAALRNCARQNGIIESN